jgi:hypothetical protein
MKQFWRVILLLAFALALPLRVQAGPWDTCCAAGIAELSAQAAQGGVDSSNAHDCNGQTGCPGNRHSSGPFRLPCSSSACAVFAGTSLRAMSGVGAWASVLVSHPETTYVSVITAPLERPPKGASF